MTDALWPPPWVRAVLDTAVLGLLTAGPAHGYGIAQQLETAGFGLLKGGSLYPLLARLEEGGWVTTAWEEGPSGPGRRQYAITDAGRERYAHDVRALAELTHTVQTLGTTAVTS